MVHIRRHFENGETDIVKFSSLDSFKKSNKSKAKGLSAYAVIDIVTGAILALVKIISAIKGK